MKSGNGAKHLKISWSRVRAVLMCLFAVICVICTSIALYALTPLGAAETREQIKARLLRQVEFEGWDPYSSNMTLDEFYALMELFDEGKLPLKTTVANLAATDTEDGTEQETEGDTEEEEPLYIPRTQFIFSGLESFEISEEEEKNVKDNPNSQYVLEYDNEKDYEPKNYLDEDATYHYPKGLDPYNAGYARPPRGWDGIQVSNDNLQATIVVKGINDEDTSISSDVDQELFLEYNDYYVKRVSVSGTEASILGMVRKPHSGEFVYYYLSSAGQDWAVSTTTLPDSTKLIVEYVPLEHSIDYAIMMYEEEGTTLAKAYEAAKEYQKQEKQKELEQRGAGYVTADAKKAGMTIESIFTNRPDRTNDGAYAFDVVAPYGYTTEIYICIDMDKRTPYAKHPDLTGSTFPVLINHTGDYDTMKGAWLWAYYSYLKGENVYKDGELYDEAPNFFEDEGEFLKTYSIKTSTEFINTCIEEKKDDETGKITLTWKLEEDPNKEGHNTILERMTERINDFLVHNNGYALGTAPLFTEKYNDAKFIPDTNNGPSAFIWNETFYNHLVRADRTIIAVLKPIDAPVFDMQKVLTTANASGRGSAAKAEWADATYDDLKAEYTQTKDTLTNNSGFPNIDTADSWGWDSGGYELKSKSQAMKKNEKDGTYSYNFFFQTNNANENYILDVLEINGIAMQLPYRPLYQYNNYNGGNTPDPDDHFPWQTVNYLADGAKVTVEFLFGWASGQRHYRIKIEGAHANVTITSLNLMQYGSGAAEFSVYNLVGVHSDVNGDSKSTEAIEYFSDGSEWERAEKSVVIVKTDSKGINFNGDSAEHHYGANIRFKVAEGYGNPYYIWESFNGGIINSQASTEIDTKTQTKLPNNTEKNYPTAITEKPNKIIYFSEFNNDGNSDYLENGKLKSQYIYYDDSDRDEDGDGYYYIRVTTQDSYKIALLTIVARPIGYVIRYVPSYDSLNNEKNENGESINGSYSAWKDLELTKTVGVVGSPDSGTLPSFDHENSLEAIKKSPIGSQYDDSSGNYYDMLSNKMVSMPSGQYGVIKPVDPAGEYEFVDWVLVDENFNPVLLDDTGKRVYPKEKEGEEGGYETDDKGNYKYVYADKTDLKDGHRVDMVHKLSGAFDLNDLADYTVRHTSFGTTEMDIYVLRFMPFWRRIENPYHYDIVLNWVDAKGELHQENFHDNWKEVITETPAVGENIYVYLNKAAAPLLDWIAQHPTFTFWDEVNNDATGNIATFSTQGGAISDALQTYLDFVLGKEGNPGTDKDEILKALKELDYSGKQDNGKVDGEKNNVNDFTRLGNDTFAIRENYGQISIWMYEPLGGVVVHKDVKEEGFIPDDEFYFTVTGSNINGIYDKKDLTGTYRAYPETVSTKDGQNYAYDAKGNLKLISESDAWKVTFREGKIEKIEKNGEVLKDENGNNATYFTLKAGEGIQLYALPGEYTITEVGSKSGGTYKTKVEVVDEAGNDLSQGKDWTIPKTDSWLKGSSQTCMEKTATGDETTDNAISQVSAKVSFASTDDNNVVQTLTFTNMTASLSIDVSVGGAIPEEKKDEYYGLEFQFVVTLTLPKGVTPLVGTNEKTDSEGEGEDDEDVVSLDENGESNGTYYYYNLNVYTTDKDGKKTDGKQCKIILTQKKSEESGEVKAFSAEDGAEDGESVVWTGTIILKSGQKAFVVTSPLEKEENGKIGYTVEELDTINNKFKDDGGESVAGIAEGEENEEKQHKSMSADYLLTQQWSTDKKGNLTAGKNSAESVVNFYKIPYGYLVISEKGGQANETFLFKITGTAKVKNGDEGEEGEEGENGKEKEIKVDLIVSVKGGGKTYVYVPCGEYTIVEISDWAWRYESDSQELEEPEGQKGKKVEVKETNLLPGSAAKAEFTHTLKASGWLGGESSAKYQCEKAETAEP